VGLVFVGLSTASGCEVIRLTLGDYLSRAEVRDRTVKSALDAVRLRLPGAC
jgi:nicotinamide mononucleotide (NMN) deamidase PncC